VPAPEDAGLDRLLGELDRRGPALAAARKRRSRWTDDEKFVMAAFGGYGFETRSFDDVNRQTLIATSQHKSPAAGGWGKRKPADRGWSGSPGSLMRHLIKECNRPRRVSFGIATADVRREAERAAREAALSALRYRTAELAAQRRKVARTASQNGNGNRSAGTRLEREERARA